MQTGPVKSALSERDKHLNIGEFVHNFIHVDPPLNSRFPISRFLEQSSNESTTSLSEIDDMPESNPSYPIDERNNKDDRVSEVVYNLSTPDDYDVVAVSVSQPPNNALHLHLNSPENLGSLDLTS